MFLRPGDLLEVSQHEASVFEVHDDGKCPRVQQGERVIFLGKTKHDNDAWEISVLTSAGPGWMWASDLNTWDERELWTSDLLKYKVSRRPEIDSNFVHPTRR